MAIEIERKFLVGGDDWRKGVSGEELRQGYLNDDPGRSVRVRLAGREAFLTVKGPTLGGSRLEFEYAIPVDDARQLLELCRPHAIEKTRYTLQHAGREWVIDEFHGENRGLLLAEVELKPGEWDIELPPWAGREVTEDHRFYNQYLSSHPYSGWSPADGQG